MCENQEGPEAVGVRVAAVPDKGTMATGVCLARA